MVTRSSRFRIPLAIRRSFDLAPHGASICAPPADNFGSGAPPADVLRSAADQMVPELGSNDRTGRLHHGGCRIPPRGTAGPRPCGGGGARTASVGTGHGFEFSLYYPLRWREEMKTLTIVFAGLVGVAAASLQATAQTSPNEIKVTAKKYEFNPSTIKVKQGDHVRLVVTALDHDHGFKLEAFNIEQLLKKGEAVTIEFTADKAGTFPIECSHFCGFGRSLPGAACRPCSATLGSRAGHEGFSHIHTRSRAVTRCRD